VGFALTRALFLDNKPARHSFTEMIGTMISNRVVTIFDPQE